MAAVGAILGFPSIIGVVMCVTVVGGVFAFPVWLARTGPGRRVCARLGVSGTEDPDFGKFMPYGPAIVVGTVVFRVWQHVIAWRMAHGGS
jgi:Flp pilus assembly protein protease CpaA